MLINGVELNIDFTDADFLERIEKGSETIKQQAEELKGKEITPAEGIRQECKILKEFLDYAIGEGTSQKLFGERNSLNECLKAYEDILKARDSQFNRLNTIVSKYSPDRLNK